MGIFAKYIIKSMLEKKLRTGLILLAVLLSGALCLASGSMNASLVNVYTEQFKTLIGNADIKVTPGENSTSGYVSLTPSLALADEMRYIIPVLNGSGNYKDEKQETTSFSFMGISLENYLQMNKLELTYRLTGTDFTGNQMIISEKSANEKGWQLGDTITFELAGGKRNLRIYGITKGVGVFTSEGNNRQALIPFDTLASYNGLRNRAGTVYIKGNGQSAEELIQSFQQAYPREEVDRALNTDSIGDMISMIGSMLMMMTVLVIAMSVFIIYSSFKVIMLEKLPIIGTFRSVGANKNLMMKVLIAESMFYGVVGGGLALLTGLGILKLVIVIIMSGMGVKASIVIDSSSVILAFVICVALCFFSSVFPILKVSKLPIKEIIFGADGKVKKNKNIKYVRGAILLIIGIFLVPMVPMKQAFTAALIATGCATLGSISLIPLIVKWVIALLNKVFGLLFGNIGVLAVKNIRGNKSVINSITLLVIGVSILFTMNNIGTNLAVEVVNVYEKSFDYDVQVWFDNMDKYAIRSLLYEDGVTDSIGQTTTGIYSGATIELVDFNNTRIGSIDGVINSKYGEFFTYDFESEAEKNRILNSLQDSRNICVTELLKRRYELVEGQIITLKTPKGNREYKIIGFCDTLMQNGDYVLIGENYMKQDMEVSWYNNICLKTNKDPEVVLAELKQKYKDRHLEGITMQQMLNDNIEGNAQMMSLLSSFSGLAIVIGIVGIVNNLIISFIERKRSLAVLRSVGMNKGQMKLMIFIEAIFSGLIGSSIGIFSAWVMMRNLPAILEGMNVPPMIYFVSDGMLTYVLAGIVVTIIASISPAFKSSKVNIIEAIKFE